MKHVFFLTLAAIVSIEVIGQTTALLQNQTDAWGINYTYTGEVKNDKPNGMGIARYSTGNVVRYVGNFLNGSYNGKGTMLFNDGALLTGNWMNGTLNGKGTNLTKDGSFYAGDFANGVKNGQGILIYKENGFVKGGFMNDKLNGRCINIWTDGKIISEVEYANDKRNGTGFQYEATTKKIFEGEWRDDRWVHVTTGSYYGFLKHPDFTSESTDEHILMGPVDSKGLLKDTSYYYDLKNHKRYFGYYDHGNLMEGILIRDDSTRFIGKLDDKGATGYCYDFKYNSYYSEGNYTNDLLQGDVLDIDLKKKTVYFGNADAGEFTGKAYFFNDKNAMYAGDYLRGRFTGQGYRLESSGRCVTGTWDNGSVQKVTSIITGKGDIIQGSPKTLSEALNIAIKTYPNFFDDITGDLNDEADPDLFDDYSDDTYSSLISFPGTIQDDEISVDFVDNNLYAAKFIETKDGIKAQAKYNELAKQLLSSSVINSIITKPVKLQGSVTAADLSKEKTQTKFDLATTSADYKNFHVWLVLDKNTTDKTYIVVIKIGAQKEE
jgi:hypothetical protein